MEKSSSHVPVTTKQSLYLYPIFKIPNPNRSPIYIYIYIPYQSPIKSSLNPIVGSSLVKIETPRVRKSPGPPCPALRSLPSESARHSPLGSWAVPGHSCRSNDKPSEDGDPGKHRLRWFETPKQTRYQTHKEIDIYIYIYTYIIIYIYIHLYIYIYMIGGFTPSEKISELG